MIQQKKTNPKEKLELHPRNQHRGRYDLNALSKSNADLIPFIKTNEYGDETIDFFDPLAVKKLNESLLKHYYDLKIWNIPDGYLCPPIPGRADYIHHIAELLGESNNDVIPTGSKIKCLDIGIGANCVYPIIGRKEYGWSFIGSEIDETAIKCASAIIKMNSKLKGQIEVRHQPNAGNTFIGILSKEERVDLSICNPPFHATIEDAEKGTIRKLENLTEKGVEKGAEKAVQNFGGQPQELSCAGGERRFVRNMIQQSRQFATGCYWFSTLISKQENIETAYHALKSVNAADVRTIKMGQGSKVSRIVAWTFLTASQREKWAAERWK